MPSQIIESKPLLVQKTLPKDVPLKTIVAITPLVKRSVPIPITVSKPTSI